jgi:hypothetical protein
MLNVSAVSDHECTVVQVRTLRRTALVTPYTRASEAVLFQATDLCLHKEFFVMFISATRMHQKCKAEDEEMNTVEINKES